MATGKKSGRRRFITREHTSDTSEADTFATKTQEEQCEKKNVEAIHLTGDAPSAFVRVRPSSKSASLDRSYSSSKNGLTLNSLVPKNSNHNPPSATKWTAPCLQPVICPPVEAVPDSVFDNPSLGFRPIRRDSIGSESSSLAGSTVDSELTFSNVPQDRSLSPVNCTKPPSHPTLKDHSDTTSRHRQWSNYDSGMLMPRTLLSSAGSASSYDNLDKPELLRQSRTNNDLASMHAPHSPATSRAKCSEKNTKQTPSPSQVRRISKMHDSPFRSDEDRDAHVLKNRVNGGKRNEVAKEMSNVTGEEKSEIPRFLQGVCRRRMAGGHVQVIPPHLVGVFDPSRIVPANTQMPFEPCDDGGFGRPNLTEVVGFSNSGKSLESTSFNNPETHERKSGEMLKTTPRSLPKPDAAQNVHHQSPIKLKGNTVELQTHPPSHPYGSGSVEELLSGENDATRSFKDTNADKEQVADNIGTRVFDAEFSDKVSNFTGVGNIGRKASTRSSDIPSVTDLFHYTAVKPETGTTSGCHIEKAEKQRDTQMAKARTIALPAAGHSSFSRQDISKHASPSASKNSPKWDSSPLSVGSQKSDLTASPKVSSKLDPPKLSRGGYTLKQPSSPKSSPKLQKQRSSPGSSPKWQYSPLAKSGQVCDATTSSPKGSPKYERTSGAKSSPKVERVPSAKASLKYENTCSPKSSPKADRNLAAKNILKSETSPVKVNTQISSQHSFKWEPSKTVPAAATLPRKMTDAELNQSNAIADLDKTENSRMMNRFAQPNSGQVAGSFTKLKADKEKQKQAAGFGPLSSTDASNLSFSAQTKQHFLPSKTSVDKLDPAYEKAIENVFKSTQKQNLSKFSASRDKNQQTIAGTDTKSRRFSAEISDIPRRTTQYVRIMDDSASDIFPCKNNEDNSFENQFNVIYSSAVDVQSTKFDAEDFRAVKGSSSQSVGAVESNLGKYSAAGKESGCSLDSEGKLDANTADTFITSKMSVDLRKNSNEKENVGVSHESTTKNCAHEVSQVECLCPQTKMFTDILESIQVVTQPSTAQRETTPSQANPQDDLSCTIPFDLVNVPPVRCIAHGVPLEQSNLTAVNFAQTSESVSNTCSQLKNSSSPAAVMMTTLTAADAVNNNVFEPEDAIFSNSKEINISDRRSSNLTNSSPRTDLLYGNPEIGGESVLNSVDCAEVERTEDITMFDKDEVFTGSIEKAIFTVDKEITFVSRLIESPENKSSSLIVLTGMSGSRPHSVSQDTEKPALCVPVSLASPPTDVFVTLSVCPLDATPVAFREPDADIVQDKSSSVSGPPEKWCIIPTCEPLTPPADVVYNCRLVTMDAVQIPVSVGDKGSESNKFSSVEKTQQEKVLDSKSFSESNDPGGGSDSRGSTASLTETSQGNTNTSQSTAQLKTAEMPGTLCSLSVSTSGGKTLSKSNSAGNVRAFDPNAVSLTRELDASRKCSFATVDQKQNINENNWPATISGNVNSERIKPISAQLPEVSPVMAALDDALAVLSSVVMDTKQTSAETSRTAVPVEKLKSQFTKPDVEKVIFSLHPETKKVGKSLASAKEGPSLSKKKTGLSYKEHCPPAVGTHHSDPLDTTDIVRQEIQIVENRRHQLVKEDSFNRPDSPMFHETLPLPKDSIIKRNREKCCESTSSSDNNTSPQMSPRLASRRPRRCKRGHGADKSASMPASEVSGYRTFAGGHHMGKSLSRHKSDIFLDTRSAFPSSQPFHRSRWHNSDTADAAQGAWTKTAQGMDLAVTYSSPRDSSRRTDQLPQRSDIQDLEQSLRLYNQQHGGRRGQSWMQMVDGNVKGTVKGGVRQGDKPS